MMTMSCMACRPVDKALKKKLKLPPVRKVWTVDEKLGGWPETQKKFFDEKVCGCSYVMKVVCASLGNCAYAAAVHLHTLLCV